MKQALLVGLAALQLATLAASIAVAQPDDEFQAGLLATYGTQAGSEVTRVEHQVAFVAEPTTDRRLAGPASKVSWRGYLQTISRGPYHFRAFGNGQLRLRLNGELLLDQEQQKQVTWVVGKPVPLRFGYHELQVDYEPPAQGGELGLFWSGPDFQWEPIPPRFLFHDAEDAPADDFQRGGELVRALRCAACHAIPSEPTPLPAPSLDRIGGTLHREWLLNHLTVPPAEQANSPNRRMPYFAMDDQQANEIADWLLQSSAAKPKPQDTPKPRPKAPKRPAKGKGGKAPPAPSKKIGQQLFLQRGCLACHQWNELGQAGWFGGGDLSHVGAKRTAAYFEPWLADPARLNRDHRMPRFQLTPLERTSLSMWLQSLGQDDKLAEEDEPKKEELAPSAAKAAAASVARFACLACHQGPQTEQAATIQRTPLDANTNWDQSCLGKTERANQPRYALDADQQRAVRNFIEHVRGEPGSGPLPTSQLFEQRLCLNCHSRGRQPGLAPHLPAVAKKFPELASQLPAMTPPSLIGVGDKLHRQALLDSVARKSVHRPWLHVEMPQFDFQKGELERLADFLIRQDRVPEGVTPQPPGKLDEQARAHGSRLVTTGGFGCTSCHRVGSVEAPQAPLNARGPDLSQLGKRIRYAWYDRWVRNPARIVPRMEMPSVKLPIPGVLDQDLDRQLAAVWSVLNEPGFEPPLPNPVRIVRRHGQHPDESAALLTDVIQDSDRTWIKPMLIGLPNRHNVFYDLEQARLVRWTIGDTARQRTKGKTWFWEMGGFPLLQTGLAKSEWQLLQDGQQQLPLVRGQFVTQPDHWEHHARGLEFQHRLHFGTGSKARTVTVSQSFQTDPNYEKVAFQRRVQVTGLDKSEQLVLQLLDSAMLAKAQRESNGRQLRLPGAEQVRIELLSPEQSQLTAQGKVVLTGEQPQLQLRYRSEVAADEFPHIVVKTPPPPTEQLHVIPGFDTLRLPIVGDVMPTALAWRPDGTLAVASLKGRVWLARDTDQDGQEDQFEPFSDDLAAPFGLWCGDTYIDVVNKYGLLRMWDEDGDGRAERTSMLSAGWAHTADYHDWAIGLPRDAEGNYYVSTACQQDKRSLAAAHWRGRVLKLSPRKPTADNPYRFSIQEISGGHRFPIGIARNRAGELFVSDNQGNYNPFNELNHVRQGARYGFLNAVERKPGFSPPLAPPAINIPHPWTRSVNGICFLETPTTATHAGFGPFEGHLVGCEYDTRRIIRMSLDRVDGQFQGAAYPFSYDQPRKGSPLLGPLTCAVSPQGDLYVGSIRDSGWGGANNIGSLVRIRPQAELPQGIAEVRARSDGFEIEFTRPLPKARALQAANYTIESYTRTSTPAYGGDDQQRRQEAVVAVSAGDNPRTIHLRLNGLRAGFVYEIRVKPLDENTEWFPAEAYYSMNRIPRKES